MNSYEFIWLKTKEKSLCFSTKEFANFQSDVRPVPEPQKKTIRHDYTTTPWSFVGVGV